VEMDWVMSINSKCAALLRPDLNIFVDVDPDTAFKRIVSTRTSTELYETNENLRKVYNNYLKAFELLKESEIIAFVNGKNEVQQVASDVFKSVKNLLHT
ncbi:MAG TPA: dTMP kinase, partial [Bacteroidia bacterium]|nr:dTMP kinase [Bacteroidia bacterium]